MRVLVFGAAGQLGEELVRQARAAGEEVTGLTRAEIDVTDSAAVRAAVSDAKADVVFNAAAYTAVDRAEEEPELAMAINGVAPGVMAAAAAETGSRFVHYSTDYVFDGSATGPIPENAIPAPAGEYGRSKLAGEQAVQAAGGKAFVVRTAWVYGLHGKNFISTVLRVARQAGEMRVVNDQRGSPTWARDLASASRRLAEIGPPGTYHLTNSGDCTWYDLACLVVERAEIAAEIVPITTADYPTPARRPAYSVLDNRRWRELGQPPLRRWQDAAAEFLEDLAREA
ncbi:MAG: dTDP-4-dehydrorhamnose reductase [Candidatus Dormibacteria bacterium]